MPRKQCPSSVQYSKVRFTTHRASPTHFTLKFCHGCKRSDTSGPGDDDQPHLLCPGFRSRWWVKLWSFPRVHFLLLRLLLLLLLFSFFLSFFLFSLSPVRCPSTHNTGSSQLCGFEAMTNPFDPSGQKAGAIVVEQCASFSVTVKRVDGQSLIATGSALNWLAVGSNVSWYTADPGYVALFVRDAALPVSFDYP